MALKKLMEKNEESKLYMSMVQIKWVKSINYIGWS